MATVSVVIPFYNRIEWTKEAIQSVLLQTFQDFEIVVVDDGSKGEYKKVIEELDNRIIYLRQENKGVSAARNAGIHQSSGEFIAFLDSDDLYLPEKLKIQVSLMKENPDVLLSHTSYNQVDQQQKFLQVIHSGLFTGNVYPDIFANCPIATPTVMLRRALLGNFEFYEKINVAEDLLLWAQISKRSTILGIDIPLTNVRIHEKNAGMVSQKQLEGLSNIIEYGLNRDSAISIPDRNSILYEIYYYAGTLYIRQKRFVTGLKNLFLAFKLGLSVCETFSKKVKFLWSPFHVLIYKTARKILPENVRKSITNLVVNHLTKH